MKNITLSTIALLLAVSSTYASTLNEKPTTNSLVVYNSNIGLVHEERQLSLDTKDTFIVYKDVASSIDTDSVNVKLPSGVTLYSQQYRYDKLTRAKLLEAFIGKKVMVGKDKVTLLSYGGISCIIKTANNLIKSVNAKDIVFDAIPKALITKPSLVWNIKSEKVHDNSSMDLDYLIKNGCPYENLDFVAIENNQLDCLKWIHKNVDKCDSYSYNFTKNLSFLNWLKSQNIPFTNDIVYCSVKKGEFNRFKWFYENGFKFNSNITTIAAKHKQFDILEYALKNGCPINQELLNEAYRTNNLNIIELVVEYDCL